MHAYEQLLAWLATSGSARPVLLSAFLAEHPTCACCPSPATTVDHIEPLERGGAPFDRANLRAACTTCNYGRRPATTVDRGIDDTPSRVW